MPIGTNPLASIMGVGGAAGDLGLAAATTKEASDTAEMLKKKKLMQDQATKQGAPSPGGNAMGDIMNGFLP